MRVVMIGNQYTYDATSVEATAKTEADHSAGRLKISRLPWGDYRLVETSPVHGYYGRAEKEFTIARDTAGQTLEYITEKDALKNTPTRFALAKESEDGIALAGAEFEIKPVEGSHFADWSNDNSVELSFDSLSFNVLTDGTIVAEGEVPAAYLIGDGSISISVVNEPTSMRMAKAASDGAPLAGAEFVIAPAAASSFADGAHAHTLVSGEDGSTETLEGALVVGDVCTVTETKAPAGYELISGSLTFGVNADGLLQVLAAAPLGYSLVDGGVAIAATLGKANLVAGSEYLLRETEAPEGYQRIEGTAAFTVAADGTVSLAGDSPEGYEIDTDGATIVVTNESGLPGLTKTNDSMGKAAAVCAALAVISVACAAASGLHGFRRRRS